MSLFCFEVLAVVILQVKNFFDPAEIMLRTILALAVSLVIGAAFMAVAGGIIKNILDKCNLFLYKIGFSAAEQRGETLLGIIAIAVIINGGTHGYISTKPSVGYRYIQSERATGSTLKSLALLNSTNYEQIAEELKVFISYKNIKKIQKLAIDRMDDPKDMVEVAIRLSKSYMPGGRESNGFNILIKKLYDKGNQDILYSIYKDALVLNRDSVGFVGAPALSEVVKAIDKKEFLQEILGNNQTPDFLAKIVKSKLAKKEQQIIPNNQ